MKQPSIERTKAMMEIAQDHYLHEQSKSGMVTPIPYAWVKNNETGELLIYSAWGTNSDRILEILNQEFGK